ncbi:MAG: DNA polymerase III subunit epsilon [Gammaproteobacteria bacterium]|nr:DNA polymerase III subunit epsilon [Gammaproteobacteria bacterium]MCH9744779.1 DNA polymerase III subunit epsilon [Gammaproteobacteria bacterium]
MLRQIILDTETTGLDPQQGHRIIEIGCLEMVNRRITGDSLHLYINPERDIEREAAAVHGITNESLKDKPVFSAVAQQIIDYIKGAELIIHNAPFDVGFLNHEFKKADKRYKKVADYAGVIDTLAIARSMHPGQHNNLDALCRRYHVDNSNRDLHGALIDAELLAQVYLLMTGGQGQLFKNSSATQASTTDDKIKRVAKERPSLRVIQPSEEELQAHQQYFE